MTSSSLYFYVPFLSLWFYHRLSIISTTAIIEYSINFNKFFWPKHIEIKRLKQYTFTRIHGIYSAILKYVSKKCLISSTTWTTKDLQKECCLTQIWTLNLCNRSIALGQLYNVFFLLILVGFVLIGSRFNVTATGIEPKTT